jgi:hypothetical protein
MANELLGELGFEPRDHDVRIERDGWVYWVRGVKSVEPFLRDWVGSATGIGEFIFAAGLARALDLWWRRRRAWKVGVVRFKGSQWGPSGRFVVVHKEVLPSGMEPTERIAQLVASVRFGEFDEIAPRCGGVRVARST